MFTKHSSYFMYGGLGYRAVVLLVLISLIISSWSGVNATPNILYAKPEASGSGDCSTWNDACTLQTALTNAVSGDQIWVMAGRYIPTNDGNRNVSFQLKSGVSVYGGFNGTETSLEQRDWLTNGTILNGDLNGDDDGFTNNEENSIHVVRGATGAILDGVTITSGNGNGYDYPFHCGGGIFNLSSNPILTNLIIAGNFAKYGAGIFNFTSSPTMTNVIFRNNTAAVNGGGLWNGENSDPSLQNIIFESNLAQSGGGIYGAGSNSSLINVTFIHNSATVDGGGMRVDRGNPTLTNVIFDQNNAGQNGGGLINLNSGPILNNITFMGNTATGSGGGMFSGNSSTASLSHVTFITNTARVDGGGMYNYINSITTLVDTTFIRNSAGQNGGGMINLTSSPTLLNTTFSGNTAEGGGGAIGNYTSSPIIINGTFNKNTATHYGGGALFNYDSSNPVVHNSILWGDIGIEIINIENSQTYVTQSDVEGGYPGTDNMDIDPMLAELGDYGGMLQTMAILPGSPVIDSTTSNCPDTDARGVPRSSPSCDLGAFESQGYTLAKISGDGQSAPIYGHFTIPLCVVVSAFDPLEPMDGGNITYTPPASGPSANLLDNPVYIVKGVACANAYANSMIGGPYAVTASASGTDLVAFNLTNLNALLTFLPISNK